MFAWEREKQLGLCCLFAGPLVSKVKNALHGHGCSSVPNQELCGASSVPEATEWRTS